MTTAAATTSFAAVVFLSTAARADDDWLGRDKALHFGVSAAIAGTGYGVTTAFTDSRPAALAIGGGVALGAGVGKELLDAAGYGTPSWKDLAWDALGTAVGLGIAYGVDALIRREPARATTATAALIRF